MLNICFWYLIKSTTQLTTEIVKGYVINNCIGNRTNKICIAVRIELNNLACSRYNPSEQCKICSRIGPMFHDNSQLRVGSSHRKNRLPTKK